MDKIDVGLLRELARDRVISLGSLDPRLSTPDIARRLRVDPTTIRDRLRAWKRDGFLLGFTVLPNCALLGGGLAMASIRVSDPARKRGVFATLRQRPQVMGWLDHVGEWVGLAFVDENAASLDRLRKEIVQIPGVDEIMPTFRVPTPACDMDLTPLDWRIVAALRAHPREGLGVAARDAGVSIRTFTRRYERLVAGNALWSFGLFDLGALKGAFPTHLILTSEEEALARKAAAALTKQFDSWSAWHVIPPALVDGEHAIADMHFFPTSTGELQALREHASELVGPEGVEAFQELRLELFGDWFDERIAANAKRGLVDH